MDLGNDHQSLLRSERGNCQPICALWQEYTVPQMKLFPQKISTESEQPLEVNTVLQEMRTEYRDSNTTIGMQSEKPRVRKEFYMTQNLICSTKNLLRAENLLMFTNKIATCHI